MTDANSLARKNHARAHAGLMRDTTPAQTRIAITAGNFARNFVVIQFGHDLLGVKPNSKATAAQQPSRPIRLYLCCALNEPAAGSFCRAGIDLQTSEIRDTSLVHWFLNNACYLGTHETRTENSGKIDGVAKFQEIRNQCQIYTRQLNNSLASLLPSKYQFIA